MSMHLAATTLSLDLGTLFVIAVCITLLLGLLLLVAFAQERVPALAWWGLAYVIGGLSGAIWRFGGPPSPLLPAGATSVLLFIALGMIWSAARLFHGRPLRFGTMGLGAAVWLLASTFPALAHAASARVLLSSLIVAFYTFLIAAELWRERRATLIRRWPALFVPMLHGAIFIFPVALATLSNNNAVWQGDIAGGWIALFVIEVVLYVVGAAFIVLILANDRTVRFYKMAAATDTLTAVLNRRGFFEAAGILMQRARGGVAPVSLLAFDLDRFKSINDRLGHAGGDAVLKLFAAVLRKSLRAEDVIGRLGGEEFVALLPGTLADGAVAAERVRAAFAVAGAEFPATVSVGVACGSPAAALDALIARADAALYRAKMNGRDRVETDAEAVAAAADRPAQRGASVRATAPA